MLITDEQLVFSHGASRGFIYPKKDWWKEELIALREVDYNKEALRRDYYEGCLTGKAFKEYYLNKIGRNFHKTTSEIKKDITPLLDFWFQRHYGLHFGMSNVPNNIGYKFGWEEQEESIKEILAILQRKSFRRGWRLLVAYLYQQKEYEQYKEVLKNYLYSFYNKFEKEENKKAKKKSLDLALQLAFFKYLHKS